MSKASIVDRENEKRVLIERNALKACRGCPFIICLMGTYQDHDCVYFLTEVSRPSTHPSSAPPP